MDGNTPRCRYVYGSPLGNMLIMVIVAACRIKIARAMTRALSNEFQSSFPSLAEDKEYYAWY
jgi:hypothetical protein